MNKNSEESDDGLSVIMKILILVSIIMIPFALGSVFLIDITGSTQEVEITENKTSDELRLQITNVEEATKHVIVRSSNTNRNIYQDTTVKFDRDNTEYVTLVAVKEDVNHPYFSSEEVKEEVFYKSY